MGKGQAVAFIFLALLLLAASPFPASIPLCPHPFSTPPPISPGLTDGIFRPPLCSSALMTFCHPLLVLSLNAVTHHTDNPVYPRQLKIMFIQRLHVIQIRYRV